MEKMGGDENVRKGKGKKKQEEGGKKCYNLQQIQPGLSFAPGSFHLMLMTW